MDNEVTYKVYKLVLTGGPCGGKSTGQARLSTFVENLGWKVFRVPETASILLSGGVKFVDLDQQEANKFQENLLLTMLKVEDTFFQLAKSLKNNCLVICDRGAMDPSAFSKKEEWQQTLQKYGLNNVDLRDNRYDHVVHMVSAANGAEDFYSTESHSCRSEGVELARKLDSNAAGAWVGHPYVDVIDNSTDFEGKIRRMIGAVCKKLCIDTSDRLLPNSEKYKFLVEGPLPDDSVFGSFQDFDVTHDYLKCELPNQVRLRKRGQNDKFSYVHTVRKTVSNGQVIEVRTQLSSRDYSNLLTLKNSSHFTVYKTRRCFLVNNQYFQFDIYQSPNHDKCKNLMLLETYSTLDLDNLVKRLPKFLNVVKNVTKNSDYSMFNLSLKGNYKSYDSLIGSKEGYSGNSSKRDDENGSKQNLNDSVTRYH